MKELCPTEALHEECGVFGIYDSTGKTNMVSAVYSALYALQHRGQESCGIALNVDGVLTGYRDLGLVSEVFTPRVLADLPQELLAKLVLPLGEFSKADASEIAAAKAE